MTDPVSKYLPEFKNPKVLMPGSGGDSKVVPASREITIRDLLTHTSGLTYRFMAQKPFDQALSQGRHLRRAYSSPLHHGRERASTWPPCRSSISRGVPFNTACPPTCWAGW